MSTEKLNEGKTVQVDSAALIDQNIQSVLPAAVIKTRARARIILFSLLTIILLLFVARVPYVGSYPDAYIFEFVFGEVKFLIYAVLLTFSVCKMFNFKFVKFLYSKKFLIGGAFILIAFIIGFSIINYSFFTDDTSFTNIMSVYITKFKVYANSVDYHKYINIFLTGGIIGQVIVAAWEYISIFIISLIALIILASGIIVLINKKNSRIWDKVRKWCIHVLGGDISDSVYNELLPDKGDITPAVHGKTEILEEAIKPEHQVPPVSFLTDTSIDHYFDNKKDGENYESKISKFLSRKDLVATYQKTIIMPLFVEISYDVENQTTVDNILKAQNDLLAELKLETFNISFKGNTVRFEIPNDKPSKVSMKSIIMAHPDISSTMAIVGMGYENNPLILDVEKHPRSLIIGRRGSGGAMLLSVIITSLAYINQPKLMELIILSPVGDKSLKYFDHLPHMKYPVISDLSDAVNKLHDLRNEISERESKFAELGATNINEANRYIGNTNTPYKEILLVVSAFDKIVKNSLQNMELVQDLLKRGPAAGVRFILLATNVNNESIDPSIYDQFDVKFILKLESEQESLRMFDNYRGVQLHGNGDGYYIDTKADKRIRFQTCYLNVDELIQIIKIIKTFYDAKISN